MLFPNKGNSKEGMRGNPICRKTISRQKAAQNLAVVFG